MNKLKLFFREEYEDELGDLVVFLICDLIPTTKHFLKE